MRFWSAYLQITTSCMYVCHVITIDKHPHLPVQPKGYSQYLCASCHQAAFAPLFSGCKAFIFLHNFRPCTQVSRS